MRHEYWNRQTLDSEFSVFLFTVLGSECWGVPVEERHPNIKLTLQRTRSLCRHIWSQNEYCTSPDPWLLQSVCQMSLHLYYPKDLRCVLWMAGDTYWQYEPKNSFMWPLILIIRDPVRSTHNKDTPGMFSWVCMHGSDPVSGLCSAEFGKLKAAVECEIARRWNGHHYLYERDSSSSGRDTAHHFITECPNELMRDDKHQQVSSHSSIRELWYSHLRRRQKRHSIQSWVGFE